MITKKLALSVFGTLTLIGSTAGFYLSKSLISNLYDSKISEDEISEYAYVIVSPLEIEEELLSEKLSQKKYICSTSNASKKIFDKNCELFKLNADNKNEINLYSIFKNNPSQKVTDNLNHDVQYVLKVKKTFLSKINNFFSGAGAGERINLLSSDDNKLLSKLTGYYLLEKNKSGFLTDKVLVAIKQKLTLDTNLLNRNSSFKLKFGNKYVSAKLFKSSYEHNSFRPSGANNLTQISNNSSNIVNEDRLLIVQLSEKIDIETIKKEKDYFSGIYTENGNNLLLKTEYIESLVGDIVEKSNSITSNLLVIEEKTSNYLIVEGLNVNSISKLTDSSMISDGKTSYLCNLDNLKDKNCLIYPISTNNNGNFDLSSIKNSNSNVENNTNIVENNYFKLSVSNDLFESVDLEKNNVIDLNKKDSQETKVYGKLKIIGKMSKDYLNLKANLFLVRSKVSKNNVDYSNSMCQLKDDQKSSCQIKKIIFHESSESQLKSINFSQSLTSTSTNLSITDDEYLLIKFTDSNFSRIINNSNNQISTYTSSGSKINDFEIISPIYSKGSKNLIVINSELE